MRNLMVTDSARECAGGNHSREGIYSEREPITAEEFAGKVMSHFGRRVPVAELEVPILQTSEAEQVRRIYGKFPII